MTVLLATDLGGWIGPAIASVVILYLVDRILLRAESSGWINYRRNGLSRPGALYHVLELQSILDPGIRQVIEICFEEKKKQDDPGDPLKPTSAPTDQPGR